ncbi:GNAT family N-acetyltransferase [Mycobacterium sp. Aquia_213]|uniref:GNAT family N-acetyltransferase, cg3035/Rv0428c family n=1 Tax=Mycobacterium sp. Aquia_213 TaxID=2991728 RepID=UPI0022718971|nr:GNAT family N-acetyltransferase [Mycobacterium sp. Aquia_213]WAC91042.1 GNAT family N-acetyltransferase [Mycobacterium sp. Aquia_213]
MVSWPDLGTRVTVRYRRRPGSVPPLTDAVGHLLAVDPVVRVRTKTGAVVEFAADDVVALRVLTDAPVRTSAIRALEHAAAAAWPGAEQAWLDGWLLRAGDESGFAANSAVPLDISAQISTIPAIVAWYDRRGQTPLLAIPDRLLTLPRTPAADHTERVLVRDVGELAAREPDPSIAGSDPPTGAAVTDAPDGVRWVGLSTPREALLVWGAHRGATRGYIAVGEGDAVNATLADGLGFRLHHRRRYFEARSTAWDTV